ncbi:hypothetical protein PN36_31045 [Candidatus Thiomargarita nelsonii]|uniref:Uncharacterized protein n=1 Tax=Candidatus Thiomargarita nelsonii TaxID=1003181 RepID=A0A4E0QL86_9GAMM|nr:hypothetical protein PN36_31045 [Candidatus Thiomargarita nelsonii]
MEHHRIHQTFNALLLLGLKLDFDKEYQPIKPELVAFDKYTPDIVQLVQQCYEHRHIFNAVMPVRISEKTLREPIPFIRNWAKTLGIYTKLLKQERIEMKKRKRVYGINLERLVLTMAPVLKRRVQTKSYLQEKAQEWEKIHEVCDVLAHLDKYIYKEDTPNVPTDNKCEQLPINNKDDGAFVKSLFHERE